jgi:hypothetical protein
LRAPAIGVMRERRQVSHHHTEPYPPDVECEIQGFLFDKLRRSPLNLPRGIVWLNPFSARNGHQDGHQNERSQAHILKLGLVSVLVSIFRPNGVDLVDFRDFRDFRSLV